MSSSKRGSRQWARAVSGLAGAVLSAGVAAQAAPAATDTPVVAAAAPDELRICAAQSEAPYSFKDESGLENRIAKIVADTMHKKPVFVWADKPAIYLVRDYLDKNLCDVVMGVDAGDPRVATTRPYYRSGYVFVSRADRNFEVDNWGSDRFAGVSKFAVGLGSPAESMLKAIGKYENNLNYMYSLVNFRSPRNQYIRVDPARMVNEVANGTADLAIAFGPEVARYVKSSPVPLRMALVPRDTVPDNEGKRIEFQYAESMAVRLGDRDLQAALDAAVEKAAPRIRQVLVDEGVPLI